MSTNTMGRDEAVRKLAALRNAENLRDAANEIVRTGRVSRRAGQAEYLVMILTDAADCIEALAQQPAAVEVDDDGRDAPAQATQSVPQGWPRAAKDQRDKGWTLEYRFLERVTDLAAPRTEYSTSMEATEQVLIAALEVLATQHQEPPHDRRTDLLPLPAIERWDVTGDWE